MSVTPETYELPESVTGALGALVNELLEVEDPLERLAALVGVRRNLTASLATIERLAVREAREDGQAYTWATIGEALGVSAQRATQIASKTTTPEDTPS